MEVEGRELIELELKYCERCGGLWLRRKGTQHVFCATCTQQLSRSGRDALAVVVRAKWPFHRLDRRRPPEGFRIVGGKGGSV